MRAIRSTNTKSEVALAKALWARGFRYRKNVKGVLGRPDLTIKRHRLAIFVDGEFFHGKDWEISKFIIKSRREFWWKKMEGNMERDRIVNQNLKEQGWNVLRFWSNDIRDNLDVCDRAKDFPKDGRCLNFTHRYGKHLISPVLKMSIMAWLI